MRLIPLALTLASAASLASCGGSKPQPPTFNLSLENPYFPSAPALNMRVDLKGASRTGADVDAVGEAVRRVGYAINMGQPPVEGDYRVISFTVHTDRPDQRDNDLTIAKKLMHLAFERSELQNAVRYGASGKTILGLASEAGWWTPRNDDVIGDYCSSSKEDAFCQRFFVKGNGEPR